MIKKKLGEIASYINGYPFKPSDWSRTGLEIIRIQNLTGSSKESNYFNGEIKERFIVRPGDILISWSATLGVFVWRKKTAVLNQHIFKVEFDKNEQIDKSYFVYAVTERLAELSKNTHGSTMKHITKSRFDNVTIPLPPLPTQQKIAEVLDKADAIRKRSQQILTKYDQLAQSVFLEMFGDPVKNEKGWEVKTLNQIFSIKHGYAFKSEYFCESSPYTLLTPGNFFEKGGYRDQGKKQKFYCGDFSKEYLLSEGDLLIAMTEQAEGLLGSCFIVPSNGLFLHNQRLGKVILKEGMNQLFLSFIYNNSSVRKIIQNSSTGTKVKHTSPTKLTDIEVGFPPISLQNQFASIITQIEKQKAQTQLELNRAEELYQSLLQRAFTGELFPEKELTEAL